MKVERQRKYAEVGLFFVEVITYVEGEGGTSMITSRAVDLDGIKKFIQIMENLRGTGMVPTTMAIRQMKDGRTLEGWFDKYLFNGYWKSSARICNWNVFEITAEGIYQVEISE